MLTRHPALATNAIAIEQLFAANDYLGRQANPPVGILKGTTPVIVAAPHAVKHPRSNRLKKADAFTGAVAVQVAMATGCFALTLTRTLNEDPNFDTKGPFKEALSEIVRSHRIKAVINLHGMARDHEWDLVYGSNFGQSLGNRYDILETAVANLHHAGLHKSLVNDADLFTASKPGNVSVFAWERLRVPSFQVEVNRYFRNPYSSPSNYSRLVSGLVNTINSI